MTNPLNPIKIANVTTSPLPKFLRLAAIAALSLVSLQTVHASGLFEDVDLKAAASTNAHRWAIFTFGNYSSAQADSLTTKTIIKGDVAVAGSGAININSLASLANYGPGNSLVSGLYFHTGGSPAVNGGSTLTTGQKHSDTATDSLLEQGVTDSRAASLSASAFTTNTDPLAPSSINLSGAPGDNSLSLTAAPGSRYVLNLSDLKLTQSTLTLNGGSDSWFIFNVSAGFVLNKSFITLAGGLTANNVLFNYTGTSGATFSSSTVNGIVLAAAPSNYLTSVVTLTGTTLNGQIIANKVSIAGGGVNTIVSP